MIGGCAPWRINRVINESDDGLIVGWVIAQFVTIGAWSSYLVVDCFGTGAEALAAFAKGTAPC